jgi:hypothetical protein
MGCESNGFVPPGPSGGAPDKACTPRVFLRHSNGRSAPRAACGRWCSSTPQTPHPDQPAAHTAFQTHWARLVSNMGHRSPHLRVLGAHFHHFKGHIPLAGQRAGRTSHTGQFSCFGPRRSCFIAPVLGTPNGLWPLNRLLGGPIYVKQCLLVYPISHISSPLAMILPATWLGAREAKKPGV